MKKKPLLDNCCVVCGEVLEDNKPHHCKTRQRTQKKARKRGFTRRFNDGSKRFDNQ